MGCRGAFTVLLLSGLLVLPACDTGKPASPAVRVGSVVRIGPYTQMFSTPLPANPVQAAVVEGFREGEVLWNRSQNAQHLVAPVRDYVTGQALTHLNSAGKTRHLVPAGTDRFFMTRVTAVSGHHATLVTCDDGSMFKEENPHTGKVNEGFRSTPGQSYIFETWRMIQLDTHWAITGISVAVLPSRAAEPCQPGMTGPGPSRRPQVAVLLRKMGAAVRAARSVHLSGTVQQAGKAVGLNFGVTRSGEVFGQISEEGSTFTVLGTHGHLYLKLSPAFFRNAQLPATACNRFCGKYLQYSAARAHALLSQVTMAAVTRSVTSVPAREITPPAGQVVQPSQLAGASQRPVGT